MGIGIRLAILLLAAGLPLAAEELTVAQLEQAVETVANQPDKEASEKIGSLCLSERLSQARYVRLQSRLPGPKARAALQLVADASAFLDLPAADLGADPPPSPADQVQLMIRAVKATADTMHGLPNFFATRLITQYQSAKLPYRVKSLVPAEQDEELDLRERSGPYQQVGQSQATVLYRAGEEVTRNVRGGTLFNYTVTGRGEFGGTLNLVMADAISSRITWSHWEQGPAGALVVFRFHVPREKARYQWSFCCFRSFDGKNKPLKTEAAYRAEMAIDPQTGSVLRLSLITEPRVLPVLAASEVIEYGAVELGGRRYICPLTNIVLYVTEMSSSPREFFEETKPLLESGEPFRNLPPIATSINHTVFSNYHLYRAEIRILPGEEELAPQKGHGPVK